MKSEQYRRRVQTMFCLKQQENLSKKCNSDKLKTKTIVNF